LSVLKLLFLFIDIAQLITSRVLQM
jgi:hypothetical protein